MFKENWAFNHEIIKLTRVLPLNIFSTFQSINALASIDWASYISSRQTFNLTLVGSEDSFLSLLLSVRLFPLPPQQLLPSLFLLLLLLLWLCPVLLPQCSAPNSERCGSDDSSHRKSIGRNCDSGGGRNMQFPSGGESKSYGYIWHSGWWSKNLIIKSCCELVRCMKRVRLVLYFLEGGKEEFKIQTLQQLSFY